MELNDVLDTRYTYSKVSTRLNDTEILLLFRITISM